MVTAGWLIFLGIILFIILLLALPVHVIAEWNEKLTLRARYLFFKFTIIPGKEKEKKPKEDKQKKSEKPKENKPKKPKPLRVGLLAILTTRLHEEKVEHDFVKKIRQIPWGYLPNCGWQGSSYVAQVQQGFGIWVQRSPATVGILRRQY